MADAEFEFDDTRKAIGAEDLDDSERKAMLNKFKDAGGEVLSERELRRQQNTEAEGTSPSRRVSGDGGFVEVTTPSQRARKKEKPRLIKKLEFKANGRKYARESQDPAQDFLSSCAAH